MAATSKPKDPGFSIAALREGLVAEPVLTQRFCMRMSRVEHDLLQRLSGAAGTTSSHTIRRLIAMAADALLAEPEA